MQSPVFLAAYPLIPWFAVMAAGYCFGHIMVLPADNRRGLILRSGLGITFAFFLIRSINIYGNPVPWSVQPSSLFTVLSFFNVTKYPPSLDFLLMTLGPALLLLWAFDQMRFRDANPLLVFGRVPLFYFLLHLFLIHAIAVVFAVIRYGTGWFVFSPLPSMGTPRELYPADYGYDLWVVYVIWCLLTVSLYPVCRWFDRMKRTKKSAWMRYL